MELAKIMASVKYSIHWGMGCDQSDQSQLLCCAKLLMVSQPKVHSKTAVQPGSELPLVIAARL